MNNQLALEMPILEEATIGNFYTGDNVDLLAYIQNILSPKTDFLCYLWGSQGAGKTHLLHAICHLAYGKQLSAMYLPLAKLEHLTPDVFNGLENTTVVCLDDIDFILGKTAWEEAFFHYFNRHKEQGGHLIVSSLSSPKALKVNLPDLKSRLTWGISFQIHGLSDEDKLAVIQHRAKARGLRLDTSVGKFILSRCSRNMNELFDTLNRLDEASLAKQRPLTIPFVKEVLHL